VILGLLGPARAKTLSETSNLESSADGSPTTLFIRTSNLDIDGTLGTSNLVIDGTLGTSNLVIDGTLGTSNLGSSTSRFALWYQSFRFCSLALKGVVENCGVLWEFVWISCQRICVWRTAVACSSRPVSILVDSRTFHDNDNPRGMASFKAQSSFGNVMLNWLRSGHVRDRGTRQGHPVGRGACNVLTFSFFARSNPRRVTVLRCCDTGVSTEIATGSSASSSLLACNFSFGFVTHLGPQAWKTGN